MKWLKLHIITDNASVLSDEKWPFNSMYGSSFFIMCGIDWIMSSDDDHNFIDVWSWWVKRECIFLLSHIIINCTQHDVCLIYSITHRRREYQFNICRGMRKCWNCSTTPKTERTKRNDWILLYIAHSLHYWYCQSTVYAIIHRTFAEN